MRTIYFFIVGVLLSLEAISQLGNEGFRENLGQVVNQFNVRRPDVLYTTELKQGVIHYFKSGFSCQFVKYDSTANTCAAKQKLIRQMPLAIPSFTTYRLDFEWIGAQTREVSPEKELGFVENYYLPSAPDGILGVKSFEKIVYKHLYEGIDLIWYKKNGELKYDYYLERAKDVSKIALKVNGAKHLMVDVSGQLVITTPFGEYKEPAPICYQRNVQVPGHWQVSNNNVSIVVDQVNPNESLLIDPLVRFWGTYLGGSGSDDNVFICNDIRHALIASGATKSSANFATTGAYQTVFGGLGGSNFPGDAFLAKYTSNGTKLWVTYFGGSGSDFANECVADLNENIFVVGGTTSTNTGVMATVNAFQTTYQGGQNSGDGFVAKFTSTGQRLWSTYYGGNGDDWAIGVDCDISGAVYFTGGSVPTNSLSPLGTLGVFQPTSSSGSICDAYIAKFDGNGNRLWGSYIGGSGYDNGHYCVTDNAGNLYLSGVTTTSVSSVIATAGAYQVQYAGGVTYGDAFLIKFDATGQRLWGTYLGGHLDDISGNLALNSNGSVVMCGQTATAAAVFTINGSFQTNYGGGTADCFVVRFTPSGSFIDGTLYGGSGIDEWCSVACDSQGNTFLYGLTSTNSGTAVALPCVFQPTFGGGGFDFFLAKFNPTLGREWATWIGGAGNEANSNTAISVDGIDKLYIGGNITSLTSSTLITTTGASQTTFGGGGYDVFIEKFDDCLAVPPSQVNISNACLGQAAVLSAPQVCGLVWYSSSAGSPIYSGGSFTTGVLVGDTTFYVADNSCGITSSASAVQIHPLPSPTVIVTPFPGTVCLGENSVLIAAGASNFTWTGLGTQNPITVQPTITTSYVLSGNNYPGACVGTVQATVIVEACASLANLEIRESIMIYPNPTTQQFFVRGSWTKVEIWDVLGRSLLTEKNESGKGISIAGFDKGSYMVKVYNQLQVKTFRLIIGD